MGRRELGTWWLLWTLVATAVAAGIVAGFLFLAILNPGAVRAAMFVPVGSAGSLSGQSTPGAPLQVRPTSRAAPENRMGDAAGHTLADAAGAAHGQPEGPPSAVAQRQSATRPDEGPRPSGGVDVAGSTPARRSGGPSPHPSAPSAGFSPSASSVPSVTPVRDVRFASTTGAASMTGLASWFRSPIGVSAAGPELRTPGWRDTRVLVTGPAGSAWTRLSDWCQCLKGEKGERIIDLDDDVFLVVCGALSRGLCKVEVTR